MNIGARAKNCQKQIKIPTTLNSTQGESSWCIYAFDKLDLIAI